MSSTGKMENNFLFFASMSDQRPLLFSGANYKIMLLGIALLALGFITMTMETAEYGFGSLGLTIGPLFLMAGFLVEIYAILHKSHSDKEDQKS